MLVISRRINGAIQIGDDIVIRLMGIDPPSASLALTAHPSVRRWLQPNGVQIPADQEVLRPDLGEMLHPGDDLRVVVVGFKSDRVRIGIEYPRDIVVRVSINARSPSLQIIRPRADRSKSVAAASWRLCRGGSGRCTAGLG